jgi:8-oxo-dGTP diphosphatase
MCKRHKEPYLGLYNLVGGKIEPDENGESSAYRELFEETSIANTDVTLSHMMDVTYYNQGCYVEVWAGTLNKEVAVSGDEKELVWFDLEQNFYDMSRFAGEGNLGHIFEQIKQFGVG